MHLIPPNEGLPLAPSLCFICEQSPQTGAVDTFRTFMTPLPTRLTGRKYVCVECIKELAGYVDMVDAADAEHERRLADQAADEVARLQLRVEQLEAVHVETLKELLAKATRPAAATLSPQEQEDGPYPDEEKPKPRPRRKREEA